jgi:hypothetical protein
LAVCPLDDRLTVRSRGLTVSHGDVYLTFRKVGAETHKPTRAVERRDTHREIESGKEAGRRFDIILW